MSQDLSVRVRRPSDLAPLVGLLGRQQPSSRYPLRWPLPFPPEQFIARVNEEQAWVAVQDDEVVGHVALTSVPAGELARIWSDGAGRPPSELACVSVLFVDDQLAGRGIGGRLLDTAVDAARASGRTPVLDVVQAHGPAVAVYRHRGWVQVGQARPSWLPDAEPPVLLMVLPEVATSR